LLKHHRASPSVSLDGYLISLMIQQMKKFVNKLPKKKLKINQNKKNSKIQKINIKKNP